MPLTNTTAAELMQQYRDGTRIFDHLNLAHGDFYRVDLTGATFRDCDLRDGNWSSAILTDVTFEDCLLDDADFEYATLRNATIKWGSALATRFAHADLTGAKLEGSSHSRYLAANFEGAVLSNATLIGCDFTGANFRRATLAGANLGGSRWQRVRLDDATFSPATVFESTAHDLFAALLRQHLNETLTPEQSALSVYGPDWAALIAAREAAIGVLTLHPDWCWMEHGANFTRYHHDQVRWIQYVLGQYPDLRDRVHLGNQGVMKAMHWHEREQLAREEAEAVRVLVQREREDALLGKAPLVLTTDADILEYHRPQTGCTCVWCREGRIFQARRAAERAAEIAAPVGLATAEADAATARAQERARAEERAAAKRAARQALAEAEAAEERARDLLDENQDEVRDAQQDVDNAEHDVEIAQDDLDDARTRLSNRCDDLEKLQVIERQRIAALNDAQANLAAAREVAVRLEALLPQMDEAEAEAATA